MGEMKHTDLPCDIVMAELYRLAGPFVVKMADDQAMMTKLVRENNGDGERVRAHLNKVACVNAVELLECLTKTIKSRR